MFKVLDFKYLLVIFIIAFLYNFSFFFFTSVPLKYQLNADAEVHLAHWRDFSSKEKDIFANDTMFKLDIRPRGELFVNLLLVRLGEFIGVDILSWSVIVSYISLAVFLSGVYFVTAYSLSSKLIGFLVGLGSVIPAFSLGGSTWGFDANGFLPRNLALGMAVWLLCLYFYSLRHSSLWAIRTMFFVAGLLANWYPLVFIYFSWTIILADILRLKSFKLKHIFYGALFCLGGSFAVYDIVVKSLGFTPIDLTIFRGRFSYLLLSSFQYAILKYLRRFILYSIAIGGLYYISKKFKIYSELLKPWYYVWVSAGVLSLVGLYLENYTTLARFFLSKISVWFILASMVIVAYTTLLIFERYAAGRFYFGILSKCLILLVFLGQSIIPTSYRYIRDLKQGSNDYLKQIAVIEKLRELTPVGAVILMDTNQAGKIRTYGSRNSYVSWKDGTIAVLDGHGTTEWSQRLKMADKVLSSGDFKLIEKFSRDHGIGYLIYKDSELNVNRDLATKYKIFEANPYALIKIPVK